MTRFWRGFVRFFRVAEASKSGGSSWNLSCNELVSIELRFPGFVCYRGGSFLNPLRNEPPPLLQGEKRSARDSALVAPALAPQASTLASAQAGFSVRVSKGLAPSATTAPSTNGGRPPDAPRPMLRLQRRRRSGQLATACERPKRLGQTALHAAIPNQLDERPTSQRFARPKARAEHRGALERFARERRFGCSGSCVFAFMGRMQAPKVSTKAYA